MGQQKKKKVKPKLLETPWQKEIRNWMLKWINTPYQPYGGETVAPMSGLEQTAYSRLQALLGDTGLYDLAKGEIGKTLGGGYDAYKSPYYRSLREGALREEQESINRLRRRALKGGTLYGTPSAMQEATLRARTSTGLAQILGGLQERERGRMVSELGMIPSIQQIPYTQAAYGFRYGALPRMLEQAKLDKQMEEWLRSQSWPYTMQSSLASTLLGYAPWHYPVYRRRHSGWGSALGGLGGALFGGMMGQPSLGYGVGSQLGGLLFP